MRPRQSTPCYISDHHHNSCQSFIRLYDLKIVEGHGNGLGTGLPFTNFKEMVPDHPELHTDIDFWFFDIIDKNFVRSNRGTIINPVPMHRGRFGPGVTRIEVFTASFTVGTREYTRQYRLNYEPQVPLAPAPQAGRGGGAHGNGGNGSGIGGGSTSQGRPGQPGHQPGGSSSNTGAGDGGAGWTGATGGSQGNQLGRDASQLPDPAKLVTKKTLASTNSGNSGGPPGNGGTRGGSTRESPPRGRLGQPGHPPAGNLGTGGGHSGAGLQKPTGGSQGNQRARDSSKPPVGDSNTGAGQSGLGSTGGSQGNQLAAGGSQLLVPAKKQPAKMKPVARPPLAPKSGNGAPPADTLQKRTKKAEADVKTHALTQTLASKTSVDKPQT